MSRIKKINLLPLLTFALITLASLEIFSYYLVRMNLLLVNETPMVYRNVFGADVIRLAGEYEWRTERDVWGAWHIPNARASSNSTACGQVEYRSNEVGARDAEFLHEAKAKRFILLGDSFAEGYGVGYEDTAQRLIEEEVGAELLNFGAAGNFGPLQYWLIYERLAKQYKHDGVVVFFLPDNDFTDNDYNYWSELGRSTAGFYNKGKGERYRPYYRQVSEGNYDFFIPENARKWAHPTASFTAHPKVWRGWAAFPKDYFWFMNSLRTLKLVLLSRKIREYQSESTPSGPKDVYSGYFDASQSQQSAAVYFIDKIIMNATAKNILLVSIPRPEDFARVDSGIQRKEMLWWNSFRTAKERLGKQVVFLDLLDYKPTNISELFNSCDGHWSPVGNKWAAGIVSAQIRKMNID